MLRKLTSIAASLVVLSPAVVHAQTCTTASYYGREYHGRRTASGEIYDQRYMTAAHPYIRFGSVLKVVNRNNGRSVNVRINDRGPFFGGRGIDLSTAAMRSIGGGGLAPVCYTVIK